MSNWKILDSGSTFDFETDLFFKVQQAPGTGMPPVSNIRSEYGLLDGALYQRTRVDTRQFSLIGTLSGGTTAGLHSRRRALIDRVKTDRSTSQQPTVIQYLGSGSTLQASGFYTGGLEFGDVENNIEANIGLGFEMLDPYWENANSASQSLTTRQTIAAANYILQRDLDGTWELMDAGANGAVNAIVIDDSENVYVGGAFTNIGGVGANRVAKWSPSASAWSALGGGVGGTVTTLDIAPDGKLYVGGAFNYVGGSTGVSACKVGMWDPDTSTWYTLGTDGVDNLVNNLIVGRDGKVYVGGAFITAGSVSASRIAVWDPSASLWSALGSGADDEVNALTFGLNNNLLYAGGKFTSIGGVTASRVAVWDISASSWTAVGSGMNGPVESLIVGLDGTIYAGGAYDEADGKTACSISAWNGQTWSDLAGGLDVAAGGATVWDMDVDSNGFLYVSGTFTTSNGFDFPDGFARWTGSNWLTVGGAELPGTVSFGYIGVSASGLLVLGYSTGGTASTAALNTVSNQGTAKAYPTLSASGPGRLYELNNFTTKKNIYFDIDLLDGEVVTLDLSPGKKTFTSNFRGNVISTILPGSDLVSWDLLPGDNNVSLYVDNDSASATFFWTPRYWSLDGSA